MNTKNVSTEPEGNAINTLLCPVFFDKNGVEIKDGMIIKNTFDRNPLQRVEMIQGKLWFGAVGTTINDPANEWCKMTDLYGFDKFWEVVS